MGKKSDELIELMNFMRGKTEEFYNALPEDTRAADGSWEVWSPKDTLAHLTFWQNNMLKIMDELNAPPPQESDFNERNYRNYVQYQMPPWAEVYGAYADSFDKVVAAVKKCSDEDLETTERFPRIPGGTLQGSILGNTFGHAAVHLAELLSKNGDEQAGNELQEWTTQKTIEFDHSSRNQAVALYNLACYYALKGHTKRTVELLQQTFPLRPDLVEYSKEDPDFDAVRDRPEFQTLYN